jgi:hypothetical protein
LTRLETSPPKFPNILVVYVRRRKKAGATIRIPLWRMGDAVEVVIPLSLSPD